MKSLICAFALVCALAVSTNAGETIMPGATPPPPPPPCTENCTISAPTDDDGYPIPLEIIELLLTLLATP